jgi:uncharacterized protein YjbI with pentapeptide repeats
MPELTADVVLRKIKSGEKVERADLRGLVMPKAQLEGVSFRRSDLDGANLESARLARASFKNASLREAFLAGADLRDANLESADLEGANLQGANLARANLSRASLEGANLQGADLTNARLTHAQLESAKLGGAHLTGAVLTQADLGETDLSTARMGDADLTGASLTDADLTDADLRRANLTGARLDSATVTGAKVHGVVGTGLPIAELHGEWVDTSADGNGSHKATGEAAILKLLSGRAPAAVEAAAPRRFFGAGDVLRNASLEFGAGASVEIQSLFEQCTIALGEGTELVVGRDGTLSGCQITGAGRLTIHGKFVERETPGIVGVTELVVTSGGSLVGAVEQPAERTRFAFEPGCMLRMKIREHKGHAAPKGGRHR